MSKAFLVASAALISGSAAFAGPYVNVENNSAFLGSDYAGSVLDLAIGYDTQRGEKTTLGAQIGPSLVNPDNGDGSTQISGKVFGDISLTEKLSVYGELAGLTSEDTDNIFNLKAGAVWRF